MNSTVPRRAAGPRRLTRWTAAIALALVACSLPAGCSWRKQTGPDFKRFSREHHLDVKRATHRAGALELTVVSGSVSEVYTVIGSESFTAHVDVRLVNRGSAPLAVGMDDVGAITQDGGETAVYFRTVTLPPGGQADAQLNVPAGLTRLRRPQALVYRRVRMEL